MFKQQIKHILSVFKDQHKLAKNYKVEGKWCMMFKLKSELWHATIHNAESQPDSKSRGIVKGSEVWRLPLMNKGHQGPEGTHHTVQRSGCVEYSHQSQDLNSSLEKSCS